MEAKTLKKKKSGMCKGKVKKTIKNVLCRPDPLFWPILKEEHIKTVETTLEKFKIDIPNVTKPHWNEIKNLPKQQRPKPPQIKKVEGLIFGINDCKTAVNNKCCSAVIIESSVNPRTIVQPLLDNCLSNTTPVLCLPGLRKLTATYFGIPSSCLGLEHNCHQELKTKVLNIAQFYKPPQNQIINLENKEAVDTDINKCEMEVTEEKTKHYPFLYRDSKKIRVFNPSLSEEKVQKAFIGQDFIKFSGKTEQKSDSKAYMTMVLKKISSNQNRKQKK